MSIARWGMGVAVALFLVGSAVRADDVSSMKSELADLKAKVAAMESAQMAPAAGGDAESLTSMKKKGAIKIGGEVQVAMEVADRTDQHASVIPNAALANMGGTTARVSNSQNDDVQSTTFTTTEAMLNFQVNASKDTYLYLGLDLDDFWNSAANQDDLLREVYFMWKNVRGSAFDVWFGKKELPFAMNKDPLILNQVTDTRGGGQDVQNNSSYLGQAWEAADSSGANGNPHAVVGDYTHPGAMDNVYQVGGAWKYKDVVKVEAAVFQSNARTSGSMTRGMFEDRSDDTMFFQSFCGRLTVNPLENFQIFLSGITEHNQSYGDKDLMSNATNGLLATTNAANFGSEASSSNDANADRQAVSLGLDYKFKPIPLELWFEYLHGWDWAWNAKYDTDTVVLGAKYGLTEAIDLYLIGDWVGIDDDRVSLRSQDEDYYRLASAVQYTFDNGIIMSLEYAHEWYTLDEMHQGAVGLNRVEGAEADVVIFGTMWKF